MKGFYFVFCCYGLEHLSPYSYGKKDTRPYFAGDRYFVSHFSWRFEVQLSLDIVLNGENFGALWNTHSR